MRTLLAIVLAFTAVQAGATAAQQPDLPKYSFTVEMEGLTLGSFRQVSGLSVETELIEYRDGANQTTVYLPGNTKYSTVKLTRTFTGDPALWDWYTTSAQSGHQARVTGIITIYDRAGRVVTQFKMLNAWPAKYAGPTLTAGGGGDVAMETLEIAHAGLQVVRPGGMR